MSTARSPRTPITPPKKHRSTYLLMSEFDRLEEWCAKVRTALNLDFGAGPYLVGSALTKADWRDVDLRAILDDATFDATWKANDQIRLMNRAFSIWGQQETGLPIDFQIQRMTEANAAHPDGVRNPMGRRRWKFLQTDGVPPLWPTEPAEP